MSYEHTQPTQNGDPLQTNHPAVCNGQGQEKAPVRDRGACPRLRKLETYQPNGMAGPCLIPD